MYFWTMLISLSYFLWSCVVVNWEKKQHKSCYIEHTWNEDCIVEDFLWTKGFLFQWYYLLLHFFFETHLHLVPKYAHFQRISHVLKLSRFERGKAMAHKNTNNFTAVLCLFPGSCYVWPNETSELEFGVSKDGKKGLSIVDSGIIRWNLKNKLWYIQSALALSIISRLSELTIIPVPECLRWY